MTTWQKIVKYAAIALAVMLIVTIIGAIVSSLSFLAAIFDRDSSDVGELQTIAAEGEIDELIIDIGAAELNIMRGETLTVKHNGRDITVDQNDGRLTVKQDFRGFKLYTETVTVDLYIPDGKSFDTANITTGAGVVKIDMLTARKLRLELGAGEVIIGELTAEREAVIDGGAGKLTIEGGMLCDLDLDMGVGKLELTSKLVGDSEIDYGIGDADITLIGGAGDYRIEVSKGLGDIKIDGKSAKDDEIIGSGMHEVEINGGVGSAVVDFREE